LNQGPCAYQLVQDYSATVDVDVDVVVGVIVVVDIFIVERRRWCNALMQFAFYDAKNYRTGMLLLLAHKKLSNKKGLACLLKSGRCVITTILLSWYPI